MKAILEFNLEDPDDRDSHKHALKGSTYYHAIWELDQVLRSKDKYTDETTVDIEWIRSQLWEIMGNDN